MAYVAKDRGLKYVSAFIFSTENWGRSEDEVNYLMKIFLHAFKYDAKKMIKDGRSYKSEAGLAPNAPIEVDIAPKAPFKGIEDYLSRFLFASKVVIAKEIKSLSAYTYSGFVIAFSSAEPKEEQVAKLQKKEQALLSEIARGEKMLSNPGFLAKAPKAKVELEQGKLEDNRKQLQEVRKLLESLA